LAETLGSLVAMTAGELAAGGFEDPRRQARRLVAAALALTPTELFVHPDRVVDEHQIGRVREILRRARDREPLSRIIGQREFWGLPFILSVETLDPRPETESVVEGVLLRLSDRQAPRRLLDLGTGSGCLLLALLSELPGSIGVGIDISEGAVRTAAQNAHWLRLAERAFFAVGDWGEALSASFDIVVTNPPYIASADLLRLPREVAFYDPSRALDGGTDGLAAYRSIAADLPRLLAPRGIFVGEVGVGQADAVAGILTESGLVFGGIERDLAGITRCVIARRQADAAA
jgi:release factor glutamine methyltransferase